ncbi:MAG: nucleotidyltransferase family protein [Dehalococcoidia bacterium]|nr:nucleotidyltransferase family protein [Dehalococcoidia bacterium]
MISSIILAAGMSSRMGQPKSLLEWEGDLLVAYQVRQLKEAGVDEVIVVLGHRADEVHRRIGNLPCRVMVNARYFAGRAGSLRIGAKAVNRDADRIIIVNVDQPRTAGFYRYLIDSHDPAKAAARPVFEGKHGHPVVVAGRLREELLAATDEEEGLHGVMRRHAGEILDVAAGAECLLDINTPEEYRSAREAHQAGA